MTEGGKGTAEMVLDPEAFRPQQRPPIPILRILDDSQDSAESVRIRKTPFRIGRVEGDVTIPLDSQMSASHAEIFLKQDHEKYVWCLKDLGSTNGTFARISQVVLKPQQVFMLGGGILLLLSWPLWLKSPE